MVTKETFGFTVETAYGKTLDKPLDVVAEYEKCGEYSDIPAKDLPDEKEITNFVNAKRKASARAAATTKALADAGVEKPTLESSAELRFNTIVKALTAGGVAEAQAKEQASALTGFSG